MNQLWALCARASLFNLSGRPQLSCTDRWTQRRDEASQVLAAGLGPAHDATLMGSETVDRVRAHSPAKLNEKLDREAERRIMYAAGQPPAALSRRIDELDREWDIERLLEANASSIAFGGLLLGIVGSKKWLVLPTVVLPFLFLHATQGWCPPVPVLRRRGIRTRSEIDAEKYALKLLRGDFDGIPNILDETLRAVEAFNACAT